MILNGIATFLLKGSVHVMLRLTLCLWLFDVVSHTQERRWNYDVQTDDYQRY